MNSVTRWKIVVSLIAIFVAGAITGTLLTLSIVKREAARLNNPTGWVESTLRRWNARLHLSSEQEEKLRPILQETSMELRRLRAVDFQQAEVALARVNGRIDQELDPRQRVIFQKMREARIRRLRERLNLQELKH